LNKVYEKGVDEVTVHFDDPLIMDQLRLSLQKLIGFEIVKQGQQHCIIRDISGQKYDEFDNSLRRLFFSVTTIMEDGIEALENNNDELKKALIKRDEDVNKFSHFCLRVLSKHGLPDVHQMGIKIFIVNTLERVGDEFRDLLKEVDSLSVDEVKFLRDVRALLQECFSLTLKPRIETAHSVAEIYDKLLANKLYSSPGAIRHYVRTLTSLIISIQEAQLGLIENG